MPDLTLRHEARVALAQAGTTADAAVAAVPITLTGAPAGGYPPDGYDPAARERISALPGFQVTWQMLDQDDQMPRPSPSSEPRCWRCETNAPRPAETPPPGPSPAGCRVGLCDDCLAYLADPAAVSSTAIAAHDRAARKQLAEWDQDRAIAERRAQRQGLERDA